MNLQVLSNILRFLERVNVSGAEAYAWCEAHQFIQSEAQRLAQAQLTPPSKENDGE